MKTLLAIFFSLTVFSTPKSFHENKGCPDNSSCSEEYGVKFQNFKRILASKELKVINSFIKENGLPIRAWSLSHKRQDSIIYDSSCKNHRQKNDKIYEAILFDTGKNSEYMYREIISMRSTHLLQLRASALYIEDNSVVYLDDFDDNIFYVKRGKVNNIFYKVKEYKESIPSDCPSDLVKKFKANISHPSLYKSFYCKKLFNYDLNEYETFIFGYNC